MAGGVRAPRSEVDQPASSIRGFSDDLKMMEDEIIMLHAVHDRETPISEVVLQ